MTLCIILNCAGFAIDGNKRKIDETGEDRAAKNPRHTLPESPQPEQTENKTNQPGSPYADHVVEEEEGPQHDLIILGLAYKVEEDELREYFDQFGGVESVEVTLNDNAWM